jgi:hypothetical protein
MPHKQRHRGQHQRDAELFAPRWLAKLQAATVDLSYLLGRGYASKAAVKLVGDHYQLHLRQRRAVLGAACPDESRASRASREVPPGKLRGEELAVDGYNLLIITESILAGGIIVMGRDGCIRDLASLHGSYRRVEETMKAIRHIGAFVHGLHVKAVTWFFDAPVSNSGRLRVLMLEEAGKHGWHWDVVLNNDTDRAVAATRGVAVSSDSYILDRAGRWTNMAKALLRDLGQPKTLVDLNVNPR